MAARNARTSAATETAERDVIVTRVFDAPRRLAFKAWTDTEQVARWWGPHGFTNPVCELDVRPGGAIRIDMRGPDGVVYPMTGAYREIIEPDRLVFASTPLDKEGNLLFEVLHTVTFAEQSGKTTLTVGSHVLRTTAEAALYLKGMETGWTQSLERLGEHLGSIHRKEKSNLPVSKSDATGAAGREIVATRVYGAPREIVWRMWTESEQIRRWWGPNGFTSTIHEMDVRPGGGWRFIMHGPDGRDYQNKVVYIEIVKPERLVYDHVSGPQFHVTVTLAAQGAKTKLTMQMLFASSKERDNAVQKYGAIEGLNQTLGRLEEQLAEIPVKEQLR